jgi:tight adherence protein B
LVGAAALAAPAAGAAPDTARFSGLDTSAYPHVRVSVVTRTPVARPPKLTEDGLPVTGFSAVNLGAAKSVVLAIDTSRSMAGPSLANATAAAQTFSDAKAPGDRLAVVSFGKQAVQLTSFSAGSADTDSVLRSLAVDSRSGTALYDAVVQAAGALRTAPTPGRVIILVTDGHDVSSTSTLAEAAAATRKAHASVYSIGIESRDFDPSVLQQIARETNGSYHAAPSSAALRRVYASIAAELERTWQLGYDTSARPGDRPRLRAVFPGGVSVETGYSVPGKAPAPPAALLPSFAYTAGGTLALALAVGVLVLLAVLALTRARRGSWVRQRLAPHVGEDELRRQRRKERLSFLAALFRATESAFGQRRQWRSIEKLLMSADVPLRVPEFVWASIGSGFVLGLVVAVTGSTPILILGAMGVGFVLPYVVVSVKVRRRTKKFEDQLPDLLATIAASLKAGHSFKHGLQAVVDESAPPASVELRRALTEAGLGRPMDDALADMAERLRSENFAFAITAVTIQRQVGGSLASLFDMVAETVRNRQHFARKIRSLTAMGRMSAYTLIGLPFFIVGMITLVNAGYMQPLYHTGTGHLLLVVGAVMMVVGSLILKKIVSFRG